MRRKSPRRPESAPSPADGSLEQSVIQDPLSQPVRDGPAEAHGGASDAAGTPMDLSGSRAGCIALLRAGSGLAAQRAGQLLARGDVELRIDAAEVRLDRLCGHEECLGDLLVLHPLGG